MFCPCHSQKLYQDCCQSYHLGKNPENALKLMRSRFSAYVLGLSDYIIKTTHKRCPEFHPERKVWMEDIVSFSKTTRFEGLKILEFTEASNDAAVTFEAKLFQNGRDMSFIEKSFFIKENDVWLYLKGEFF